MFGPLPGMYEVHQPEPDVPLYLHMVSHTGLAHIGRGVDPRPLPGGVNVLFAHGIFMGDSRMQQMLESHGEQRVIPRGWADRGWDAVLLSDLHILGAVPGYGTSGPGQVWYTGSALRRGFSDQDGPRGWLRVDVQADGAVQVSKQTIWQRPQMDLPVIDSQDLTAGEVDATVRRNVEGLSWWDAASADITGDGGFIVRQRITGVSAGLRRALTPLRGAWDDLAKDGRSGAAWWAVDVKAAATPDVAGPVGSRLVTARVADFAAELTTRLAGEGRVAGAVQDIPAARRDEVVALARSYLAADDAPVAAGAEG